MIRPAFIAALFLALLGLPLVVASPALAHAALLGETPAAGATVTAAPAELRLSFSEALELSFCRVVVTSADGTPIATGALALDPSDPKTLLVPLGAAQLKGNVTVEWTAVSADGHKTKGSYSLTISG